MWCADFFAQRLCNIKSSSTLAPWLMTSHLLATSLLNSNCERTLQITLHLCFKDLYYVRCGHSVSSFCVRQQPKISQEQSCFGFRQQKYQRIASVSLKNEQLWITNCHRLIIFIEIAEKIMVIICFLSLFHQLLQYSFFSFHPRTPIKQAGEAFLKALCINSWKAHLLKR